MTNLTRFSVLFMTRSKGKKNSELEKLYARVTVEGERVEFSLSRDLTSGLFDTKAQKCLSKTRESQLVNDFLSVVKGEIHEIRKQLMMQGKPITAEGIKAIYKGEPDPNEPTNPTILELYDEHNEKFEKLVGTKHYSKETYKRHKTSRSHIASFISKEFDQTDLDWEKVDSKFLNEYFYWLKATRKCQHNSAMKYVSNFAKITRLAYDLGYLQRNPMDRFKITMEKVERPILSESEIDKILDLDLSGRLDRIRDCFVFSIHSGLPFADLEELTMADISEDKKGNLWINKNRHKTDINMLTPILPVNRVLIEKYENDPKRQTKDLVLPVPTNQKYNAYLKEIGDLAGINKNLTTHLARHTFATTVTLNNGIPIEIVSKMLGHSNLKTTQIYAKVQQKAIEESMGDLMKEKKKGKKKKKKNKKKRGKKND